jgi:OFA family oxalate/formate antiporter-like MFS transporter
MKNKQGLLTVGAAIAIQLTLGVAYIWSVFQTGIANNLFPKEFTNDEGVVTIVGDSAAAGLTFSLLLATLTIGSVIGGKLVVKYSTRKVVLTGGFILSAGFMLASFVTPDVSWALWLTYGVMGGVGMGFTYSTTMAAAVKWYPHKKGLITGIIVSSLGFGGVVFTPIVEVLILAFGGMGMPGVPGGEQPTFRILSVIFLVVCTVGSFFLKSPHGNDVPTPPAAQAAAKSYTPSEMLKTPWFYIIIFTFMLACMGGLMMMNFAKPIAEARDLVENPATGLMEPSRFVMIGVLAITMFNSVGRLVWGMVSDKLGRKNTIIILLSGNALLSLLVTSAHGVFVYILIAFIGFFYGGFLSTFPSLIADIFGTKHMATNYGIVLLGFGTGAIIASQIAGHYRTLAAAAGNDIDLMFPAFLIASCCAAGGIVLMVILKIMRKKNKT